MSEQQPYEGQTTRLPQYTAPAASAAPTLAEDEPIFAPRTRGRRSGPGRLLVLAGIVLLLVALFGGRTPFGGGFTERTAASSAQYAATNLRLDVGDGNVTIVRGADDQITVDMTRHGFGWTSGAAQGAAERLAPAIKQDGDTVEIEERRSGLGINLGRSSYVEYTITLPRDGEVNASTGSGDVAITEIGGAVALKTGSGDVTLHDTTGRLDITVGSGDIRLADGTVAKGRLQTGSGDITLEGVQGELEAHTGSGNIQVDAADAVQIEMQTGSGNIEFSGSLSADGASRAQTGSGNIALRLPADTDADVEAISSSGRISSDWQLDGSDRTRTGRLGSGGTELKLQTGSGNIELEQE